MTSSSNYDNRVLEGIFLGEAGLSLRTAVRIRENTTPSGTKEMACIGNSHFGSCRTHSPVIEWIWALIDKLDSSVCVSHPCKGGDDAGDSTGKPHEEKRAWQKSCRKEKLDVYKPSNLQGASIHKCPWAFRPL
jgi:hypothetical protein